MKKKIDSYLGFAKKSGSLIAGYNTCAAAIEKKKLKLLIICEDVSENSMEKIRKLARAGGTEYRIYGSSEEIGHASGSPGRGIFGVADRNFADVIKKEIDSEKSEEKEVF